MGIKSITKNQSIMTAICIGTLCSVAYLAVYFARNILSAVTPEMIETGYTEEYIGRLSSVYFICYAVGQLINGSIGDKVKARYMISMGLCLAGVTSLIFPFLPVEGRGVAVCVYGLTGFFLAMIYGPMTKVVAENTEPVYATRCTLGYTFASFIGSPCAGFAAAFLAWQSVFVTSSVILICMAVAVFSFFLYFEKKGVVRYNRFDDKRQKSGNIKVLLQHRIIKFTFIAVLTGITRTTVVFWLPTYISQYLGFSAETSAMLFTAATLVISFTAFISVFVYERLGRNMDLTILLMFSSSSVFFGLVYLVNIPAVNIIFIVLAIMSSNGAATMLWSRYCPSLRDTGMVSGATGFLDFMSYMAASVSSTVFANAVTKIGWGNLILVWLGLMLLGVVVALSGKSSFKVKAKINE